MKRKAVFIQFCLISIVLIACAAKRPATQPETFNPVLNSSTEQSLLNIIQDYSTKLTKIITQREKENIFRGINPSLSKSKLEIKVIKEMSASKGKNLDESIHTKRQNLEKLIALADKLSKDDSLDSSARKQIEALQEKMEQSRANWAEKYHLKSEK